MSRHLSRLILCGLLGGATLLSGCALVRKDSAPHQQLAPEQIKLADDIHRQAPVGHKRSGGDNLTIRSLTPLSSVLCRDRTRLQKPNYALRRRNRRRIYWKAGSQLQVAALGMLNRQRVSANGF